MGVNLNQQTKNFVWLKRDGFNPTILSVNANFFGVVTSGHDQNRPLDVTPAAAETAPVP
jgi:hypothetical protein